MDRDELPGLLKRVREISALPDDIALDELEMLALDLAYPDVDYDLEAADDEFERIQAAAQRLRDESRRHRSGRFSSALHLEEWARTLGNSWPTRMRKKKAAAILKLQAQIAPFASETILAAAADEISMVREEPILNVQQAERMQRDLDALEDALSARNALAQFSESLRAARERVARFRWQKKVDEAEVAEAGGNEKKATKLRGEALAMLRQDWRRAFGSELPVDIASA